MKRMMIALAPLAALALLGGCDEALIASLTGSGASAKMTTAKPTQDQIRLQLHLMDGSCDGMQRQYGGPNDSGGGGSGDGNGDGQGDQDRRRDGSCGDGG